MGRWKTALGLVAGTIILALLPATASAQETGIVGLAANPDRPHSDDAILVKLQAGATAQQAVGPGTRVLFDRWIRVPVPTGHSPIEWVRSLAQRPGVAVAELDVSLEVMASAPLTPNDPEYLSGLQWHLERVQAEAAWQISTGTGIKVAVLDGGVSINPDSGARDGFCRDLVDEYDAVNNVSGPGSAFDLDGHGTHVAGTVAQCTGNGRGVAGMAPDAHVMPVAVLNTPPNFSLASWLAAGIDWARSRGARVINMSLGCDCTSSAVSEAIERAAAADIVMVAAAGNTGGGSVTFPANDPRVIAVAGATSNDARAQYSPIGPEVDLAAPGGSSSDPVWQETFQGSTWDIFGSFGTSMASPHVAGAATLLRSQEPTSSADRIRSLLRCTAADLGQAGDDDAFGTGILRARSALDEGAAPGGCRADRVSVVAIGSGLWRNHFDRVSYTQFFFGNPGDVPFMGDWDCDGVETPGLYRQADGFVYLRNANSQGTADVRFFFGNPGDVPLAGDFNGNGCDTVSIYRPAEARFYIINKLGSGDGGLGAAETSFLYGNPGDAPFVGDWNGDGIDTPGLRRPTDGFVYLRNSNTQGIANTSFFYGDAGDQVFAGDWDGNGSDSIGLYRPLNGTVYLRNALSTGVADSSFFAGAGLHAVAVGP